MYGMCIICTTHVSNVNKFMYVQQILAVITVRPVLTYTKNAQDQHVLSQVIMGVPLLGKSTP